MKIKDYLDEINVPYSAQGKNVTSGYIEMECPFCGMDPSMHLGVNLVTEIFHCWICTETGNMVKLARTLESLSWAAAKKRVEEFGSSQIIDDGIVKLVDNLISPKKEKEGVNFTWIDLPREALKIRDHPDFLLLKDFLTKRKITNEMAEKYDLHYCRQGMYRNRLVIPIYNVGGDLLGFTSRDMTGKSDLKYKHPRGFPIKNCLYNLDIFEGRTLFLVEGCIDAMRIGKGAVALFNSEMSLVQETIIRQMKRKGLFDEIVICLDDDAYLKAIELGEKLSSYKVKVLQLPTGKDPADLGREKIMELLEKSC